MSSMLPAELREQIALSLTLHDRIQLAQVNKEWHLTTNPVITFHERRVMNNQQEADFLTPESQHNLARHSRHMRVFRTRSGNAEVPRVLSTLPELQLTSLSFVGFSTGSDSLECLVKILERCHCLRILQFLGSNWDRPLVNTVLLTIARTQHSIQRLELLSDLGAHADPPVFREFLETVSSTLEELSLMFFLWRQDQDPDEMNAVMRRPVPGSRPHPNLRSFKFGTSDEFLLNPSLIPSTLVTFLEGCTGLEIVQDLLYPKLDMVSWIHNYPVIRDTLASVMGIRYREINVDRVMARTYPDESLARDVQNIGYREDGTMDVWHSICLEEGPHEMPTAIQTIVERAQWGWVERIYLNRGDMISSEDVKDILYNGTRLFHFECERKPSLTIWDALSLPWNCTQLTQLDIMISWIPRPDVTIDWMGAPIPEGHVFHSGTLEASRQFQEAIYTRLSTLVHLECLQLGSDGISTDYFRYKLKNGITVFFDPKLQQTCLEMSLDSGLGLLAGLKRMKSLVVYNMEHRIGVKEMEWVEKAWPNFRVMRGVFQERGYGRPYGSMDPGLYNCRVGFEWS